MIEDEGLSFSPQTLTITLATTDKNSTGVISVPEGMALVVYEIQVGDVSGATTVDFSLDGFDHYVGGTFAYTNDQLPAVIPPLPVLVSKGGASITVSQPATPVSSTNKFLVLGIVCPMDLIDRAKRLAYGFLTSQREQSREMRGA